MNLTIVYITNRDNPQVPWFLESLTNQCGRKLNDAIPQIIVVDSKWGRRAGLMIKNGEWGEIGIDLARYLETVKPKPTVWSGQDRLTKEDWWSASNSRNTGICLCKTDWLSFVDDRSVLLPGWLDCVKEAMAGNYAVFGQYEKRHGMTVENGVIKHGGIITGKDVREEYCEKYYSPPQHGLKPPYKADRAWGFGCALALPLEWCLAVNGWPEECDGLGGEDTMFSLMLYNNGFPIKYDTRMRMVEDRTPGQTGPVYKREDFGVSPQDYSHRVLAAFQTRKSSTHGFDIRALRKDILAGKQWPKPCGPTKHAWDNRPLSEL